MGVGERVHHLAQDPDGLGHRQLAFAGELGPERLALDVRHDVVEEVARGAGGEQRHDVGVLQPAASWISRSKRSTLTPAPDLRRQHLDDHLPAEPVSSARKTRLMPPPPSSFRLR